MIYHGTVSANQLITGWAEEFKFFSFMLFTDWSINGLPIEFQFREKLIYEEVGRQTLDGPPTENLSNKGICIIKMHFLESLSLT